MSLVVVSVFDSAVQAFGRPAYVHTPAEAVRSFRDEVNNPESYVSKHPEDYELHQLAIFDERLGSFEVNQVLLVRAKDLKETSYASQSVR